MSSRASSILRSILGAYLEKMGSSDRGRVAKQQIIDFLDATCQKEVLSDLEVFASSLLTLLENCFYSSLASSHLSRSKCIQREKLWVTFHRLRLDELNKIWEAFFSNHPDLKLGPSVYQYVSQQLYCDLITSHFSSITDETIKIPELTISEENILRYAAGYVPLKLLRDKEDISTQSPGAVECLTAMAVNGEESSLLEYTRNWIFLINKGGLFEINDMTYSLFREIEMKVRRHLLLQFNKATANQRESIISTIASDESIQFFWTILSVDIEDETQAVTILKLMIGLWLNIRGFSLAGTWQDNYMCANKISQRKKALRKDLKRKSEDCSKTLSASTIEGSRNNIGYPTKKRKTSSSVSARQGTSSGKNQQRASVLQPPTPQKHPYYYNCYLK